MKHSYSYFLAALAAATLAGCQPANRQASPDNKTFGDAATEIAGTRTVKLNVPNMT